MGRKLLICAGMCVQFICFQARSQSTVEYPEVGKIFPNVTLQGIQYYKSETASISDLKGKWLILDFFSTGCTACFESLPKMNEMNKELGQKIQVIMVGRDDKYIRPLYERHRVKQNLDLAVVYDTVLFSAFEIKYVPYIVILDENSVVRAITTSITKENMSLLLEGKMPILRTAMNAKQAVENAKLYDWRKPLLIDGNGGNDGDFLYRSVLAEWKGDVISSNQNYISALQYGNRVQVVGVDLKYLYDLAYGDTIAYGPFPGSTYGKFAREPIVEVRDPSLFKSSPTSIENRYSYSLIIPEEKSNTDYLRKIMQGDLENYFGFDVKIETRRMPCYKLVATDRAREALISRDKLNRNIQFDPERGMVFQNCPVSALIEELFAAHQLGPPFIDETGIKGNINVTLNAIFTDLEDVKRALQKKGLDLIRSEAEMKTIIIMDKNQSTD